ncbi:cysteine protease ATG4B isoform X3 [Artibeus jamaicensis]|uniref:cysteine protease ATG4B isoform X3 n=1 Tax=Artibeus jamaicensis TaxID=9417 RepID=UPI00235AD736|nr:cysteine protease ATG4B isoform X3 [Artibeus jamaicensis]
MPRRPSPYGKMAALAGPESGRPDALTPRLRCPPSPASAALAGRCWGFRNACRRPLECGQRKSNPSFVRRRRTSKWRPTHFPLTSGSARAPDWPWRRPVASRCGPVGATRLSVGGRRGKMDAATLTYDTLRFAEFEDFPETSEPVWILGRKYSVFTEKDEILSDVASRLWFTYRKNFPAIGGTGPTSDTGWGCMLRCGQMIFAQALLCRHLGRDWRWTQRKRQPDSYFHVLNAFIDRKDSYYSIHQIAQMGVGEGKSIGQWYGPNTVAQVLKKLAVFDTWSALAVHVAMDNTVVMEDINSEGHCNGFPSRAEVNNRLSPWRPLVLLIPLRLGLTDINEAYVETLKGCFMMPQSLGVIGGKPNSAHYFIGYVGEELIYLDPHTTQPVVEFADSCSIPDESFHCQHPPSRMNIGELDPSIAVGFFCETEDDFGDWCQQVRKLSLLGGALPMFELVEQQPSHLACPDVLNLSVDSSDVERLERFFDSEDEDFEILSL